MGGAASLIVISSTGEMNSTMAYNDAMTELSINYDLITETDPLKRDIVINNWMIKNQAWMDKDYGRPGFHPESYGLVVVDNQKKRILDYQGYRQQFQVYTLSLEMVRDGYVAGAEEDVWYDWKNLQRFMNAKKAWIFDTQRNETYDIKHLTSIVQVLNFVEKKKLKHSYLCIDHDWEFIDFEIEPNNLNLYYEYCLEHYGKFMNDEDKSRWKTYMTNE